MERRKKALICLFLLVSLILPRVRIVKAEALPIEVAEATATVADVIMTYYADIGCAVTDSSWISTLYNDLGTSFGTIEDLAEQGLLVLNETTGNWESTAQLATAIENTSAYASLELNEMFSVSAQEAAALGGGAVAATGGTILGSACAGVASIGVVPLLGAVSVAYWAGIGIGTLIAHAIGLYGDGIKTGSPITANEFFNSLATGVGGGVYSTSTSMFGVSSTQSGVYFATAGTQGYLLYIGNKSFSGNSAIEVKNLSNGTVVSTYNKYISQGNGGNNAANFYKNGTPNLGTFRDLNALNSYINSMINGEVRPNIYSPDIIGPNGNQQAEEEDGKYTYPDVLPQVDTSTEAGRPLRQQDWLNFANQANTNTGAGQRDLNKDLFDDIMDRIRTLIPNTPDPSPDPTPDPGGQTRPVPTPTPVPDPDYDVPQPEQPEWQSETTQQTEDVPDSIPTGKPWVVEGLQNKFPFCIPWDIKNMLGKFASASRQAPYIQWRFNPPFTPIDYTFQIDLADFEDAAAILRTLELIAFIVGLAFATRYLIGAT